MVNKQFYYIGIIGQPRNNHSLITHKILYYWLLKKGYEVIIEIDVSKKLKFKIQIKRFLLKRGFIYYRKMTPCDNTFHSYVVK